MEGCSVLKLGWSGTGQALEGLGSGARQRPGKDTEVYADLGGGGDPGQEVGGCGWVCLVSGDELDRLK